MACSDPRVTLLTQCSEYHITMKLFTECRNEDSVAEIDTNSIFMIWGLNPLLALYSSFFENGNLVRHEFTLNHSLYFYECYGSVDDNARYCFK